MLHPLSLKELGTLLDGEEILLPSGARIRLQIEWDEAAVAFAKAYSRFLHSDITSFTRERGPLTSSVCLLHLSSFCVELAEMREQ